MQHGLVVPGTGSVTFSCGHTRMPLLTQLRFPTPGELIARISVRARIIAIAVIPVLGFLANGVAFTVGESEVDTAFRSAQQADLLANASREFKVALTSMRMSAKEFVAQPSYEVVNMFSAAHAAALM